MEREKEEKLVHAIRNAILITHRICRTFVKEVDEKLREMEDALALIDTKNENFDV